ncbi:MAG: Dihydrofolate reductase [Candidatus Moranbacteria bacterium GW2011_GWC2_37_8]|nr:MAG: Dihydrofolate reductase [Candidatus Moranbacteria bacterium GW2011_GWC2_37_8]KKQ63371.1 MAG: Dihydrofolate reductase [Parcubacteria group bacterium GW2011_GWC1_38_22]KKQ80964.1 MAG: Dihydrofolate reductase [Candidatus Moranbacteria bacterium GW2011_GWD2_38_7]
MNNPKISIICAIAENRAIGKNNQLLWHIPEDFKHFKNITSGHVILMGKKTFESIGKPLPNRANIVITRDTNFSAEGIIVANSVEEAINKAKEIEKEEVFIIGGGQIYQQAMNMADKLYLTVVEGIFDADTFFPDYSEFKNVVSERKSSDENFKYIFLELIKE